jgi:hypothetical protein
MYREVCKFIQRNLVSACAVKNIYIQDTVQ